MRKLILFLALLAPACDDEPPPYTWGDAVTELSDLYCSALADPCGYTIDAEYCSTHNSWHLCEPDMSCDVEVDEEAVRAMLADCAADLAAMDDTECFVARQWGWAPESCRAVLDLNPGPQGQDAGS